MAKSKAVERRESGLCCSCGNQAILDESRCEACKLAKRERNKRTHAAKRDELALAYAARVKAGICPKCKTAERSQESVYCLDCLNKQRSRQKASAAAKVAAKAEQEVQQREERKQAEACLDCGGVRYTKFRCRACYAQYLEKEKGSTRYDARKTAGLCQSCDSVASDGVRCDTCRISRRYGLAERKAAGLCVACGKADAREGYTKCAACAKAYTDLYAARKAAGLCPHCGIDTPLAPGKHCERCRATNRKKDLRKNRKARKQVIEAYGGVCKCCGEPEQGFLQVDHIHNDGAAHRRELFGDNRYGGGHRFYCWLRKQGFPKDRFQLLCANCNLAKARYGRCPHQDRK